MHARETASRRATEEAARAGTNRDATDQAQLALLQRAAGNAAVTRLIQRKDGPASTDAPGARHGGSKPAEKQKPHDDVHARVLKFEIDGDGLALVTLSAGSAQGVADGMPGSMLEENGKEYVDFTVEGTAGGTCKARFRATQDMVNRGPNAIIKASQYKPPESQAGKDF